MHVCCHITVVTRINESSDLVYRLTMIYQQYEDEKKLKVFCGVWRRAEWWETSAEKPCYKHKTQYIINSAKKKSTRQHRVVVLWLTSSAYLNTAN